MSIPSLARLTVLLAALLSLTADAGSQPAPIHFRLVRGFAVAVPVSINGSEPVDMLLDTGSTHTSIDPALAQALAISPAADGASGSVTVATLLGRSPAGWARASLAVGPVAQAERPILIQDLPGIHALDPGIRGILGQDFLSHTDFLLDFRHSLLIFDSQAQLLTHLAGPRTPLLALKVPGSAQGAASEGRLPAVPVAILADYHLQRRFLMLDSGAAFLVLFATEPAPAPAGLQMLVSDERGAQRLLPSAEVRLSVPGRQLETIARTIVFSSRPSEPQGLLPLSLFHSVFVSNSAGFVLFDPRPAPQGSGPSALP